MSVGLKDRVMKGRMCGKDGHFSIQTEIPEFCPLPAEIFAQVKLTHLQLFKYGYAYI